MAIGAVNPDISASPSSGGTSSVLKKQLSQAIEVCEKKILPKVGNKYKSLAQKFLQKLKEIRARAKSAAPSEIGAFRNQAKRYYNIIRYLSSKNPIDHQKAMQLIKQNPKEHLEAMKLLTEPNLLRAADVIEKKLLPKLRSYEHVPLIISKLRDCLNKVKTAKDPKELENLKTEAKGHYSDIYHLLKPNIKRVGKYLTFGGSTTDFYFFGSRKSTELNEAEKKLLDEIVTFLKDNPNIKAIQINCYSNIVDGPTIVDRGVAIKNYLIKQGIAGERIPYVLGAKKGHFLVAPKEENILNERIKFIILEEEVATAPIPVPAPAIAPPAMDEKAIFEKAKEVLRDEQWEDLGSPRNFTQLVGRLGKLFKIAEKDPESILKAAKKYREKYFVYKKEDALSIRTTDQHYFADLSREKGEKQLYNLVRTARVEENWVYVEYKIGAQKFKRWYECGTDQTDKYSKINYYIIPKLLKLKNAKISHITFYHLHPVYGNSNIPSDLDIYAAAGAAKNLRKNYNYTGRFDFALISFDGKLRLTPEVNVENFAGLINRSSRKPLNCVAARPCNSIQIAKELNNPALTAEFFPKEEGVLRKTPKLYADIANWIGGSFTAEKVQKKGDIMQVEPAFKTLLKAFNADKYTKNCVNCRSGIVDSLLSFALEFRSIEASKLILIAEDFRKYVKIKEWLIDKTNKQRPSNQNEYVKFVGERKELLGFYEGGLLGKAIPHLSSFFRDDKQLEELKAGVRRILLSPKIRRNFIAALKAKNYEKVTKLIEENAVSSTFAPLPPPVEPPKEFDQAYEKLASATTLTDLKAAMDILAKIPSKTLDIFKGVAAAQGIVNAAIGFIENHNSSDNEIIRGTVEAVLKSAINYLKDACAKKGIHAYTDDLLAKTLRSHHLQAQAAVRAEKQAQGKKSAKIWKIYEEEGLTNYKKFGVLIPVIERKVRKLQAKLADLHAQNAKLAQAEEMVRKYEAERPSFLRQFWAAENKNLKKLAEQIRDFKLHPDAKKLTEYNNLLTRAEAELKKWYDNQSPGGKILYTIRKMRPTRIKSLLDLKKVLTHLSKTYALNYHGRATATLYIKGGKITVKNFKSEKFYMDTERKDIAREDEDPTIKPEEAKKILLTYLGKIELPPDIKKTLPITFK